MRLRVVHLTHFLSFVLGCSITVLYLIAKTPESDYVEKQEYHLIIVILSNPNNSHKRDAIRSTWADRIGPDTQYLFSIGGEDITVEQRFQMIQEQKLYGDLLFLPIKDSYENLTRKLLKTFKHLASTYNFKYVLKCDDDTYVNVGSIEDHLKNERKSHYYWGYFSGMAHVMTQGKWKETDWFLCDRYLPYALGGGYVLSSDLVEHIVNNIPLLSIYKNEDVSVGTWLSPLNITRQHDVRFDTAYKARGCQNSDIVLHKRKPEEMKEFRRRLTAGKPMCNKEFLIMKPYEYNWSVLPSQCCQSVI